MALDHPYGHPDDPSVSVWTDEAPDVRRLDPSGAFWFDADICLVNRKGGKPVRLVYVIVATIEQQGRFRSRLLPVCCPGGGSRRTPAWQR
jgi:hypothetical protein